jgi:WD40 repeat protein
MAALEDPNPDVREAAVVALWKQGAKARAAIPALKKAVADEDASVRNVASRALVAIIEAAAHEDLVRKAADRKLPAEERRQACRELAANNRDDEASIASLETLLAEADVKDLAAGAIKHIRARRGVGAALVRTIRGGGEQVVFSPDGTLLAGAVGREVKMWDALTGKDLLALKGFPGPIESVEFSADGKTLETASEDATVKLRDPASGQMRTLLEGHGGWIDSLEFSPDGKSLATASEDGTVKLWDAGTGRERATLTGHTGRIRDVDFSPDGKTLATQAWKGTLKLWDAATGQLRATLKAHAGRINSVVFSPDGKTLVTIGEDTAKFWDTATGQERRLLKDPPRIIWSAVFSPDGKTFITTGHLESKVWDAATGQERATLKGTVRLVSRVRFTPDGKTLITANRDGGVALWDVDTWQERATVKDAGLTRLSPDGKTLATAPDFGGIVTLRDVATGQERAALTVDTKWIKCMVFSPDSKMLATGDNQDTVKLWDVTTGKLRTTLKGHTRLAPPRPNFFSRDLFAAFSPDGNALAVASEDGAAARLWDISTGQLRATLEGCWPVAFSPDGKALATAGNVYAMKRWDVVTGKEVARSGDLQLRRAAPSRDRVYSPTGQILAVKGSERQVELRRNDSEGRVLVTFIAERSSTVHAVLSFSPSGRTLACEMDVGKGEGDRSRAIVLMEVSGDRPDSLKLKPRAVLKVEADGETGSCVQRATFSPSGKLLAAAVARKDKERGQFAEIKLWDARTDQELASVQEAQLVTSASFSPDGKFLASVGKDGTIKLWAVEVLLASARRQPE